MSIAFPADVSIALSSGQPLALRARWVLPIDRPPIEGGVVSVAGGKIVAVGENTSGPPIHDLGDVAMLPGLVNAHTHLEFSLLDQPLGEPGMRFADWIGCVVGSRRELAARLGAEEAIAANRRQAVERGLAESRAAGVVALGEIATTGQPVEAFPMKGVTCRVFLELLALDSDRVEPLLAAARQHVERYGSREGSLLAGLSPHSPYTVHPTLLERVSALSAEHRVPVAMHVAESPEELELLAAHTGSLVQRLKSLDAWHPDVLRRGLRPMDYLQTLATAHHALIIHGNYLAADEIAFLAGQRQRMSVVYCPRTHAYFGHQPYPLAQMLAAGVRVAVGTDSRASNPDLNLLAELRHIARHHPAVPPDAIVRMGTLWGAEALGVADQFGSLTPGKQAALVTFELGSEIRDPIAALLDDGERAAPLDNLTDLIRS